MFAQVIQGRVSDPNEARAALERWVKELAPGATGWLGTTAGVTEDGQFIAVARFDSEEVAQANSDRPEQGEWWSETAGLFEGEATFRNSREVMVDVIGDPDEAGFVQIIQGRNSDPERARTLMEQDSSEWADFRPDIIGSFGIDHGEGDYTMVLYFTSEEEAREGERKEAPPELAAQMEEMNSLGVGTPDFFDLKEPWLHSPT